jgi:hypothetical protein
MFFLLRVAFWLSIVLVLMPSNAPQSTAPKIDAGDAVSAAFAAVSDMGNFCDRQPEACAVGGKAAIAFGQRAQAGAKFLFEVLSDKMAPAETGSIKGSKQQSSQDTLTAQDMKPAWRGAAASEEQKPVWHGPLPPKDPRRPA